MLALVSPKPPSLAQFGDRVGALYAVPNRFSTGGGSSCLAWLAGDGRTRIDQNGCIHFEHGQCALRPHGMCDPWPGWIRHADPLCNASFAPPADSLPPRVWDRMLNVSRTLGGAIGVPFRVDLFASSRGVRLGEFTANPFSGRFHCAVPDGPAGVADACYLGRMWREGLGRDGGPDLRAPPLLHDYKRLETDVKAQCRLVMRQSGEDKTPEHIFQQ